MTLGSSQLAAATERASELGLYALRVLHDGEAVLEFGEQARPVVVHSIRKSLMSALFGQAVARGAIALDDSVGDLGIDDTPALTELEKTATVRHLLEARSGVYLPLTVPRPGIADEIGARPERGAHRPGTFWHYNNWDFNVLGNIYERATGKSVFLALDHDLARPLGFQDWDPYRDSSYEYKPDFFGGNPRYPQYRLRLSARDLAAFGLLHLRGGDRDGTQVVPGDWVTQSTSAIADTGLDGIHAHYGYLWWVPESGLPLPGSYSALGMGGQFVTVLPEASLVVVGLVDTSAPDLRPVRRTEIEDLLTLLTE
jgi:CubicO group peptidase (beta-lactamase class C family)